MFRWKLVLIILIASLLGSMSSYAQSVTINKKKATLQEILLDIYDQTKFYFYTNTDILKKTKKININVKNVSLTTALDLAFKGQPVKYELKGQLIIVSARAALPPPVIAESKNNSDNNDTSVQELDRVQIIGYGTTTRRLSTGNVNSVSSKVIEMQPVTNPLLALQGRVPGLMVTQTNGLPGSPVNVQIRGRNSIAASNNPLYIVDGVPFSSAPIQIIGGPNGDGTTNYGSPFNLINPDDIESIDILKDADATAIYGSRGANGVIIITTKKAKDNKLRVTANINTGFGEVTRTAPMLNTQQYLQVRRDGLKNSGLPVNAQYAPDLVLWDTTAYFDWQDWYMGSTAKTTSGNVSVSFGNERNKFLISSTYHEETSVLPGETKYKRGNVHGSYDYLSKNKRLEVSAKVFWTVDKNSLKGSINGGLSQIVTSPPNYPIYDSSGKYYWITGQTNYLAQLNAYYKSDASNLNANSIIKYTILKGLVFKTSVGYNKIDVDEIRPTPSSAMRPGMIQPKGSSAFGDQALNTYMVEPQLNYTHNVSGGKLDVLAGTTYQHNIKNGGFLLANNFNADDLLENADHGNVFFRDSVNIHYKYLSVFGRAIYNYKNRYILSGTIRRDGTSRFGPGRQYGNFFSVAGAWLFSNEEFIKDAVPVLSFGKIRTSYGTTGNDGIADYGFMSTYSNIPPYGNTNAVSPSQPANKDYRWELNKKFEIGLETGFFRDRIFLSTSWYYNSSTDQLLQYQLPSTTGFISYQANLPAVVVNKGWEFELSTVNIHTKKFMWRTQANLFLPQNMLKSFPEIELSTYANQYIVGKPLDNFQALIFTGVDRATGNATFRDVNQDSIINNQQSSYNNQNGDKVYVGSGLPSISGGILNTININNFQLDFLFHYVRQIGYNLDIYYQYMGTSRNEWTSMLNYWKNPYDNATYPAPAALTRPDLVNFSASDRAISNNSFLRLKNISLTYDFRDMLKFNKFFSGFKMYLQAQNILTFTNYNGYDPEISANRYLMVPPLKVITIGLKVEM